MTKKSMKRTSNGKVAAEIVAGLAAVGAAAAAGYYFYGSKQAKQHRGAAAKWAADMKKEVIRETKRLKAIDAKDFARIVDTVMKTYLGVRSVDATDVKRAARELKSNWEVVLREAGKTGRKSVSKTKAAGKRAVAGSKKTVKKVVKNAVAKAKRTTRKSR